MLSQEELADVCTPHDPIKVLSNDIDLFLKESIRVGEEEVVEYS